MSTEQHKKIIDPGKAYYLHFGGLTADLYNLKSDEFHVSIDCGIAFDNGNILIGSDAFIKGVCLVLIHESPN